MKSRAIPFLFFSLIPNFMSAQDLSLVHTFPYDREYFTFVERWEPNEGIPGGPAFLGFLNNQTAMISSAYATTLGLLRINTGTVVQRVPFDSSGTRRFPGRVLVGRASSNHTLFSLPSNQAGPVDADILLPRRIYTGTYEPQGSVYQTGDMLFAGLGVVGFFSWEKQTSGQYLYRDPVATRQWMTENGHRYGVRSDLLARNILFFGETRLDPQGWYADFRSLGFSQSWVYPTDPQSEGKNFRAEVHYIGRDIKGLDYYYKDNFLGQPGVTSDPTIYSPSRTYIILDPWSMRVLQRTIPGGQYKIQQRQHSPSEPYYHLGGYDQEIHPLGDIYLFSANTRVGGFDLMRLRNTWWAELGLDRVQVGQILGNHIPLRATASTSASVVAYNYENEYVKVLEESAVPIVHEGRNTTFVRVQKISGAVGWIPKSVIYFEPTE